MEEKRPNEQLRRERDIRGWSQRALAELLGTTEQVVNHWERGSHKPNRHFQTQLCHLFGKNAEELGFLLPSAQKLPGDEQPSGKQDKDQPHHDLLQTPLVITQSPFVSALNQEFVSKADETIKYCWQLYYSGGAFFVEQFLPAFLSQLVPQVQQPSKYQEPLANIISRTYQLAWLLCLQHQDFGQALAATKQSFLYAELAHDPNLLLASFVREAHTFFHLKNPTQQLFLHEKAMQHVQDASPLLQSWLYLVLAESHAHLQNGKEADHFLGLARDTFPQKPEHDPNYSYVPVDAFWFANHEVMAHLHLHHPTDAWNTLTKFQKIDPTVPLRVEFTNRQLATLSALNDLQEACNHFEATAQAAKQSGSSLRYNEVCTIYTSMRLKWPSEARVRRLEEILRS